MDQNWGWSGHRTVERLGSVKIFGHNAKNAALILFLAVRLGA